MRSWPPVDRDDLRHAAGSAGFDAVFPLLIRHLIAETAVGLESIDMPGGSGTAAGGFDGVVRARDASPFIPQGVSVWELSVDQRGQAKADDDYSKRIDAPDGLATANVSYVEAILAPWTKARIWSASRNQEGRWLDVRAYNLDRIHAWLDFAPATTIWLASQLGKAMPGVRNIEVWWNESWLQSTRIPLDRLLVLAGREAAATELVAAISADQKVIALGGNLRADEACAFLAAALEDAGVLQGGVGARTLYVSDATSLERLLAQPQSLILLLADPSLAKGLALPPQHQLIVLATPGASGGVAVPRVDGQIIAAQLESAGLQHDQAARLGVLGRRSLPALRRVLALHPALHTPSWASVPDSVMRRLLLLGSWSEAVDGDRRVVATFAGVAYEQVQARAERLESADDIPFLSRVDDVWHVVAVEDAWTLLAPSITGDDLEAFRAVVSEVLAEGDPVLQMPPEDRWKAGLTGVRRGHSRDIRRGLAETLALMGATGTRVVGGSGRTTAEFATLSVRDLLAAAASDDSYRGWISLADVLGELAEAAPHEFLNDMRAGLLGDSPAHSAMFGDRDPEQIGIGSSSPHTYFLWALERLAWSADYIDEATDILAGLAEIDPGGRLANRPIASLVGVLSAWSPNTSASTEDRIRCIRNIGRRYSKVGFELLTSLIPNGHGFQTVHPGPRYRDWKRQKPVTYEELREVVQAVVDLMVQQLGEDTDRLTAAIEKLDDVSSAHRSAICDRVTELAANLSAEDRAKLYDALRQKLAHHRENADNTWALPEDQLRPIQAACEALVPTNPVLKYAWLFRSDWVNLGDLKRRDDIPAYEAAVRQRRAYALGEVVGSGGLDSVLILAEGTEYSDIVGFALADNSADFDDIMLDWISSETGSARSVAAGYVRNRLRMGGTALRDALVGGTTDVAAQARVLLLTNDPVASWEKLKTLDPQVADIYWREFVYFGLGHDFTGVLEAAWAMLDVGRAAATLHMMVLYMRKRPRDAEAAQVVATALEMLLAAGAKDPELPRLDRYHFEQLFALLAEHRESLGAQRVVALEWQLYPITGLKDNVPTLHRAVVEDPGFFAELAALCFRSDTSVSTGEQSEDKSDADRSAAVRAYDVLRSCLLCPGMSAGGEMNATSLRDWVAGARSALAAVNRSHIGDLQIGELLANAPAAADGSPLHEAVRDLLEDLQRDDIDRGIEIGIYNGRGVTSRGVYDGGAQEREMSERYLSYADAAKCWPRTRRLFQGLAAAYEGEARRLDARTERLRQGFE